MKRIQFGRHAVAYLAAGLALGLPNLAWAFSLGELADNIYAPTAFVTQFVIFGCYAVGIALALAGIMQYKNHKQNPKLVPLSIPITLFILSGILLILPFISKQGGGSWSAAEKVKQEQKTVPNTSPFATPDSQNRPFASPPPASTDTPGSTEALPPVEEDSGHWGTKH
jgi:hypothetical protein